MWLSHVSPGAERSVLGSVVEGVGTEESMPLGRSHSAFREAKGTQPCILLLFRCFRIIAQLILDFGFPETPMTNCLDNLSINR